MLGPRFAVDADRVTSGDRPHPVRRRGPAAWRRSLRRSWATTRPPRRSTASASRPASATRSSRRPRRREPLARALNEAAETPSSGARCAGTRAESVAVAAATGGDQAAAQRWLGDVRHRRLAITGDDFVAAGLSGPPVGVALDAATEAMLDGRAPTPEAQLAAGLEAAGA